MYLILIRQWAEDEVDSDTILHSCSYVRLIVNMSRLLYSWCLLWSAVSNISSLSNINRSTERRSHVPLGLMPNTNLYQCKYYVVYYDHRIYSWAGTYSQASLRLCLLGSAKPSVQAQHCFPKLTRKNITDKYHAVTGPFCVLVILVHVYEDVSSQTLSLWLHTHLPHQVELLHEWELFLQQCLHVLL